MRCEDVEWREETEERGKIKMDSEENKNNVNDQECKEEVKYVLVN